ncbi:MAG: nuclear transport factor 2 family protein [Candidatus Competibacter sp.]|nr:nuclear transport factor 2 family protein [Candidatus Competibacter sp.]
MPGGIGRRDFHAQAFTRLNKILPGGMQLHVQSVLTDGDWAVVELRSHATARNGMRFDNRYCRMIRFEGDTIVEVRAYLDFGNPTRKGLAVACQAFVSIGRGERI